MSEGFTRCHHTLPLCWRVEGWNIVIELDCHPPLNWDHLQAGLCKWTLIWESVCPGHRASSAKKSWLGPPHFEPRVSGCTSGEHELVVVVCICASDSLHHALGNRGSTWGTCQHNDKKEVMNTFWRKLCYLLSYKFDAMPPPPNNHRIQSCNDLSLLCIPLFFYVIKLLADILAMYIL